MSIQQDQYTALLRIRHALDYHADEFRVLSNSAQAALINIRNIVAGAIAADHKPPLKKRPRKKAKKTTK